MVDSNIKKLAGSVSAAKALAKADQQRRENAPRILNPSEVRGEYDADRMLTTTLGGVKRLMTIEDLVQFRKNAAVAGRNFVGGITARQVIDRSLTVDRDRARKEITWATPVMAQRNIKGNLAVRFNTDASQRNGASRHYVLVEFLGYQNAVVSGAYSASRAARGMAKEKIKFDCDCGRHTYWLRYLSTIGNYNAGRAETGYPKERNPNLVGIACKHVLRVMAEIEGSVYVHKFLERAIEKARLDNGKTQIKASQKDANKNIEKQATRSTSRIDSRAERDLYRSRIALRKRVDTTRKDIKQPKVVASGSRKIGSMKRLVSGGNLSLNNQTEAILMQTIKGLGLSREQAIALLKNVTK